MKYIRVIPGKIKKCTIDFNFELDDFNLGEGEDMTALDYVKILGKLLFLNMSVKGLFNMMRLSVAGVVEFINNRKT